MRRGIFVLAVAAAAVWEPIRGAQPRPEWPLRVATLPSPSGTGAAQPQLSVSSRGVLLSWIETRGQDAALKFAERTRDGWSPAKTVASGSDWFVNWADVPSVVRLSDGTLVAHWLQRSGPDTYAYDVRLSYSRDEGTTWAPAFSPHHDGTKTEHGFASIFELPGPSGGVGLVWLDGRQMKPGHAAAGHDTGDMSLRYASYSRDWKQTADTALDLRVCECCPTAAAMTSDGPLVAYRDRAEGEVRDIQVTRLLKTRWTEPTPVFRDGWQFPACPVNGPAVSARGRDVALAWFQAKDNAPKAFLALSRDAGRTFSAPIRLHDEASLGRVDVEALGDGSAAAAYIEISGGSRAEFRVKRVAPGGLVSAPVTIAPLANNRSSGYPRMALSGTEFVFAWVDRDASASIVRTAVSPLPRGRADALTEIRRDLRSRLSRYHRRAIDRPAIMATPDNAHAESLPSIVLFAGKQSETLATYSAFFEAAGLWVATAADPVEAFAAVQELKPDLVITEEFDEAELDFVHVLKSTVETRTVPVILLSRRPVPKVVQSAREQPDICLVKPVPPDALLQSSETLIGHARARRDRSAAERAGGSARPVDASPRGLTSARRCPGCANLLEWVERGRLYGVEYDYYRWCANGCGLYCYDCAANAWVKLA